jgi:hypothetical protein
MLFHLLLIPEIIIDFKNCFIFPICSWIGQIQQVITATPRQIESLIRLSEALARIRFSEWVSNACFVSYLCINWIGVIRIHRFDACRSKSMM